MALDDRETQAPFVWRRVICLGGQAGPRRVEVLRIGSEAVADEEHLAVLVGQRSLVVDARQAMSTPKSWPEFVAIVVAEWCAANGTATVFIDPGSPWQNAWIESFNSRLRDELLNGWQFDSLLEARILIEDWRIDYNTNRPHTAHGDLTPAEFAHQHQRIMTPAMPQAA